MTLLRLCVDDPVVRALRDLHAANVVRIPSARVAPLLSLAQKNGELSVRGAVGFLLDDPDALDLPIQIQPRAELSQTKTRAIDKKMGLKILAGLLQGFGIALAPVEAAIGNARQLRFTFQQVRQRFIDANALGAALTGRTLSPKNPAGAIYFGKGAHRLYVVDSVLESVSFGIQVVTSRNGSAPIDLGAVKAALPDELQVKHAGSDVSQIVFEGARHLSFAFTCLEVELKSNGKVKSLAPRQAAGAPGSEAHKLLSLKPAMLELVPRAQSDLEWFEGQNLGSLRDALKDPKGTRERIRRAVGQKGLDALLTTAGLGPAKESPAITDILFLHGIMGAHLDGLAGRPWFSFWSMLTSRVAERIRLLPNGTDAEGLRPGDHLNMFYGNARAAWKDRGYDVWPVSYDWRKDIVACADGLHAGIEKLAQLPRRDGTPRRMAIVAHSMGGVVASLYASRHPGWEKRIRSAVFMGSPLKGSFAPFEAITGTYPFFRKLDLLALHSSLHDFQVTSVGLPGLLALLPDADLNHDLLDAKNWPSQGSPVPDQGMLDLVRKVQPLISNSPLLARTSLLASISHGTVSTVVPDATGENATGPRTGKGDGTVPALSSACVAGAPTYEVFSEHSDLPNEWDAIAATTQLLEGDRVELRKIEPEELDGVVPLVASAVAPELMMRQEAAGLRARLEAGRETVDDVRWLLSSDLSSQPGRPIPPRKARANPKRKKSS